MGDLLIVTANLIVGTILIVGLLLLSLSKKSPCALSSFAAVTVALFLMLRIMWLGIIPSFQLLLLFIVLFWLGVALVLLVIDYVLCGNEL